MYINGTNYTFDCDQIFSPALTSLLLGCPTREIFANARENLDEEDEEEEEESLMEGRPLFRFRRRKFSLSLSLEREEEETRLGANAIAQKGNLLR